MDYTELLPPDEVASLAAGLEVLDPHDKVWREFAALAIAAAAPAIRKAERERCAITVIDSAAAASKKFTDDPVKQPYANNRLIHVGWDAAAAIRALPEEPAEQGEPKCN